MNCVLNERALEEIIFAREGWPGGSTSVEAWDGSWKSQLRPDYESILKEWVESTRLGESGKAGR